MSSCSAFDLGWDRSFPVPINVTGGPTFRTLHDVRAYLLDLPQSESHCWPWERAAELVMRAAEGGDLQPLQDQIISAFFLRGDLVAVDLRRVGRS
jgi:hypothetical protein